MEEITTENWYQQLISDLKQLAFEGIVKTKWLIGKRILQDELKFGKPEYGSKRIENLAKDLNTSKRELWYCIQFAKKCDTVAQLQNKSWHYIEHNLLPEPEEEKTETPALPEGKYRVIYADPPWDYGEHAQHGKKEQKTTLASHYASMSDEELCSLPINDLTLNDAVLFIWVTSPLLERVFKIISAWGFQYKTSMIWDKVKHNVGYYVSVRHEFLLICTKGSCLPKSKKLFDSVQTIERSDIHSEKPMKFYQIIEEMYSPPYIELFARKERKGWKSWGNAIKNL